MNQNRREFVKVSGVLGLMAAAGLITMKEAQAQQQCGDDFLLVCPGVRPSWAQTDDQKRSMTPSDAIKAGADYLVIGRPITAAPEPVAAWEKICEELAALGV